MSAAQRHRTPLGGRELTWADHVPGPEGAGREVVVLVMGTGAPGRVWEGHQVPALRAAGLRPVTVDNRGVGPDGADTGETGFAVADLVADVAALVAHLDRGPVHLVGTSLGSRVVVETALAHPDRVRSVVALAGAARREPVQDALTAGELALHDAGIVLPERYHAAVTALHNLAPRTLADTARVRDWLDLAGIAGSAFGPGVRAQHALQLDDFPDRRAAYAAVRTPTLVVGFADDRMMPPAGARELAESIPGAQYAELADCGHYGYLERPEEVNARLVAFLTAARAAVS